jgi:CheY-like chemotaxis protein
MKILILDDDQNRHKIFAQKLIGHEVVHTYTAMATIACLKNEYFDYVFLDHDLGGKVMVESGEGTGYQVAEWLSHNVKCQPTNIIIHSFNPAGAQNMKNVLPNAEILPGAWIKL